MVKLQANFKKLVASYLRAAVTIVGATQGFNLFDARGWPQVFQSLAVAAVPPLLLFLQSLADTLDDNA